MTQDHQFTPRHMQSTPVLPHHFLIVAPPYDVRSGGVMVLHDLCSAINQCGHKASVIFILGGSDEKQDFNYGYSNNEELHHPDRNNYKLDQENLDPQIADILSNGTVIYPDLIKGNPFNAKRVIRFILNKNTMSHGTDYVLTYSSIFCQPYDFALPKMFIDPNINAEGTKHWTERTLNLTYIGKGYQFINSFRVPGSILVERAWPRDKEQLGLLLRQCKFFFTWDCVSATNYDAVLCGAVPILLHDNQIERGTINKMEFGSFPSIPFKFKNSGELELGDIDQEVIEQTDRSLAKMNSNFTHLQNSWTARVGQFLNHYTLFMHSKIQ